MTIIEFYDKNSIENIAGAVLCRPERVILVGDDERKMINSRHIYKNILIENGINTEIEYVVIDKSNLLNIVVALDSIAKNETDIVFDLTGGDDLYLVAVGIIMERYKGAVQSHRFNFTNDTVNDCDADGKVVSVKSFDITVKDNIAIYGGDLITDENAECYTYDWQYGGDFPDDVERMWDICNKNPGNWNAQIGIIGEICEQLCEPNDLKVSYNPKYVNRVLGEGKNWYWVQEWLLIKLQDRKLINSLNIGEDKVSFKFKDEQVKRCLTIAGQLLEHVIASRLRDVSDQHGDHMYNDVLVGAAINWDNDNDNDQIPVINEIDVVAMKGVIPVFISCKNGFLDVNELYKLNTVAEQFGGKYAKRVLVTSNDLHLSANGPYLEERMKEMGIIHINKVSKMNDSDLRKKLAFVWREM